MKSTNVHFDVWEDMSYLYIIYEAFLKIPSPSLRQQTVFVMVIAWCSRLLLFLTLRIIMRGEDFRFTKLMTDKAYNLFGWTSGGMSKSL